MNDASSDQTTQMEHDHEACMAAGKIGDEHSRLEPFVGTWNATVRMWMQPGQPPSESTGTMVNAWALGGRYLQQNYTGDFMGSTFEGVGFWGYNNVNNKYEGFWIDSMSTFMMTETGDFDDATNTWEMLGETPNPQDGGTMPKKSIIKLVSNDKHIMEMHFGTPDGGWFKSMEIEYTRA